MSGRGVGMDVVKAQTAAAGGRVEVASTPGAGTRFSIRLPLTLAVTQTLLVEALGRSWAVPANMIVQAMELKPDALQAMQQAHGTEWQGEHYPYRYLPRLLGDREVRPAEARYSWVLLLRAGAQTLALHVDGLRGNQEVIVKNAGPQLTRIVGMSGATVLGDGEIVLILNPVALAARAAAPADEAHAGLFGPAAEAPPPLHLPTVMVVDDSLTVRKITGRLLEREGYRVITAKDGVDALEQLIDLKPDVVLDRHRDAAHGRLRPRPQHPRRRPPARPAGGGDHLAPGGEAPPLRRGGRRRPLSRQALPGGRAARAGGALREGGRGVRREASG